MKVECQKKHDYSGFFEPGFFESIIITIETQEEATELGHRLNCDDNKSFDKYCKAKGYKPMTDSVWLDLGSILLL